MRVLSLLALWLCSIAPSAQWSKDLTQNLQLSDGMAQQSNVVLAADGSGFTYATWVDLSLSDQAPNRGILRMQKLDAAGHEMWAPGGIVAVTSDPQSASPVGPIVGMEIEVFDGVVLIAYQTRGTSPNEVRLQRVNADGAQPWGPSGVDVSSTILFQAQGFIQFGTRTRLRVTPSGVIFVAVPLNPQLYVGRFSMDGSLLGSELISAPAQGPFKSFEMDATSDHGVVFAWELGGILLSSLIVQKLDSSGTLQWGPEGILVYGRTFGGNVGMFELLADESGGAYLARDFGGGALKYCSTCGIWTVRQERRFLRKS